MNYSKIFWHDTINGLGLRVSLFVSGCTIRCPGCFNESAWDFSSGEPFTKELEDKIINTINDEKYGYSGISILGGEPLDNSKDLSKFLSRFKKECPNKDIWLWTGYDCENIDVFLENDEDIHEIIKTCDYLVIGPFIEEEKNLNLKFRGSNNQEIYKNLHDESEKPNYVMIDID